METAAATAAETTMNIGVPRIPSAWFKSLSSRIPSRALATSIALIEAMVSRVAAWVSGYLP